MTFPDGGYKYEGESLETTSIIYRYEQMDCEEFEARCVILQGICPVKDTNPMLVAMNPNTA